MYVLGKTHIDKQGRMNISCLFGDQIVNNVIAAIDIDKEMVEIIPAEKECAFGNKIPIDHKGRIIVPVWIRDQIKDQKNILLFYQDGKYYFAEQTGNLL